MRILKVLMSCIFTLLCFGQVIAQPKSQVRIFLIGDSTMADKPGTPDENPERGWGQLLAEYCKEGVRVNNHAVNGRSSKSFITEGRWQVVLDSLSEGDYVFIQFGHNDQKYKDPTRFTNPWSTYRANLEKFVNEARMKNARPVLFSSIVRRHFNEYGTLIDTHGAYPAVVRMLAYELGVRFVDMQLITEQFISGLGPELSKEIYLWITSGEYVNLPDGKVDDTHLSLKGARAYAELVVNYIKQNEWPLAELFN